MTKTLTRQDIVAMIQALIEKEGTQVAAAQKIGISPTHIGEIIRGTRDPGPTVLRYFGLGRETIYKKTE
jgi:plasmid maintenance system antidote protein VapI